MVLGRQIHWICQQGWAWLPCEQHISNWMQRAWTEQAMPTFSLSGPTSKCAPTPMDPMELHLQSSHHLWHAARKMHSCGWKEALVEQGRQKKREKQEQIWSNGWDLTNWEIKHSCERRWKCAQPTLQQVQTKIKSKSNWLLWPWCPSKQQQLSPKSKDDVDHEGCCRKQSQQKRSHSQSFGCSIHQWQAHSWKVQCFGQWLHIGTLTNDNSSPSNRQTTRGETQ